MLFDDRIFGSILFTSAKYDIISLVEVLFKVSDSEREREKEGKRNRKRAKEIFILMHSETRFVIYFDIGCCLRLRNDQIKSKNNKEFKNIRSFY